MLAKLTDSRQLNDTRIFKEFHEQRIVLIDFDGAIVTATNDFIFSVIIGVNQCNSADISARHHPQTFMAVNIVTTNVF